MTKWASGGEGSSLWPKLKSGKTNPWTMPFGGLRDSVSALVSLLRPKRGSIMKNRALKGRKNPKPPGKNGSFNLQQDPSLFREGFCYQGKDKESNDFMSVFGLIQVVLFSLEA